MSIQDNFHRLAENYASGITRDPPQRVHFLQDLEANIRSHESEIYEALHKDLHKSKQEALMTEVSLVYHELKHMRRHLKRYQRSKWPLPGLSQLPGRLEVRREPYGVVLIMSPWNYPFLLNLVPLIDAIAAGNLVYLKPSNDAPATADVIRRILGPYIDQDLIAMSEGGREVNEALLEQPFDYFFFTGSPRVGRVVMEAAAKHLAPVTLELGGKSPVIIDKTADLALAAKRILFSKLINSGQTCVTSDYLVVHREVKDPFLEALKSALTKALPDEAYFLENYPKIINEKQFKRLTDLVQTLHVLNPDPPKKIYGETRQIYPYLVEATWTDEIMEEEIFGPILPILEWSDEEELLRELRSRPKPLALYLFSEDKAFTDRVLLKIPSGGVTVQDTLLHMTSSKAPFGGVGNSGFGQYHGRAGFETFSRERSILHKMKAPDIPWRHHPYTDKGLSILQKLLR